MIGQKIQEIIASTVKEYCSKRQIPQLKGDIIKTDNIGEVVQKLAILHIRMWMIEDQLGVAQTAEEIASLKKKTDICFKIKRPKLVQAINRLIEDAVVNGNSLVQDSVKLYQGVKN